MGINAQKGMDEAPWCRGMQLRTGIGDACAPHAAGVRSSAGEDGSMRQRAVWRLTHVAVCILAEAVQRAAAHLTWPPSGVQG